MSWMPFDLSDAASWWAARETLLFVILGTLGLMILFGFVWRAENRFGSGRDEKGADELRRQFSDSDDDDNWRKMV